MSSIKSFPLIILIGIAVAGLSVSSARAAVVWNFVGGELLGAQNVIVNIGGVATSFDVAFGDGSCIALYTGCNEASDFAINTLADATAAAQALLNQVIINTGGGAPANFDNISQLTNGCEDQGQVTVCSMVVLYGFVPGTLFALSVNTSNFNLNFDFLDACCTPSSSQRVDADLSGIGTTNAVFSLSTNGGVNGNGVSPVPLPAALPLFGSALAMLGIVGWRRKRRAAA